MIGLTRAATALLFFLFLSANLDSSADRVELSPRLQKGQVFLYQISVRSDKRVKTESNFTAPMAPDSAQAAAYGLLRVEVAGTQPAGNRSIAQLRTQFIAVDAPASTKDSPAAAPSPLKIRSALDGQEVDLTLLASGRVSQISGLDTLKPEQQQAWQEWLERFAVAAAFPQRSVAQGEKWKSDEPESSPSQIASLFWVRNSQYVHDEPCPSMKMTMGGAVIADDDKSEICAVILTTAKLEQRSSPKDATPEDYKLHDLRTMGTARGKNEVITYISRKTGLVIRATEDANQSMDLTVAKTDGSNRVHYTVDAQSHARIVLISDSPLTSR